VRRQARRKRHKSGSRTQLPVGLTQAGDGIAADEAFAIGPLEVARFGRFIYTHVNGGPAERRALSEAMRKARPEFKKRVMENIAHLLEALRQHDPIELIAWAGLMGMTPGPQGAAPETEEEDPGAQESRYQLASIEYLQSLALGCGYPECTLPVTKEVVRDTLSVLADLRQSLRWYYIAEQRGEGEAHGSRLARLRMIDRTLFVRGEAYAVHAGEILRRVHSCADPFLLREFGFQTHDLVELVDSLIEQFESRVNDTGRAMTGIMQAYVEWMGWCEERGIRELESTGQAVETFSADHPADAYLTEDDRRTLREWASLKDMVRLTPATSAQRQLAECLSLPFGANAGFLSEEFGAGWPLNETLVRKRPLIKHQGDYFSPDPRVAACYARQALETLIDERDPEYFRNSYANARHDATVALVAEKLRKVFGEPAVSTHLFYSPTGIPLGGLPEVDLLVVFGGAIVAVEVKTGGYEPATRRGAPLSLRDQLRDMVETGQRQIEDLHQLLLEQDVVLRDAQGKELKTLRTDNLRRWFSVVVTLEDVSAVSTQPIMLSDLGFKWEAPKALVVSLPDCLVLTDLLDNPSDLLHYLHRRQAIIGDWGVMSEDELDYVMYYIREGLWFEDESFGRDRMLQIGIYTEELDDYYLAVERGWEAEKPRPRVPDELRQLLRGLESHPEGDAIEAILFMLDGSSEARQQLAENIERSERQTLMDKGVHSLTQVFGDRVLFVGCHSKPGNELVAAGLAGRWWKRHKAREAIVVIWVPLLGFGSARAWRFRREPAAT
jgi:hypothetical protein